MADEITVYIYCGSQIINDLHRGFLARSWLWADFITYPFIINEVVRLRYHFEEILTNIEPMQDFCNVFCRNGQCTRSQAFAKSRLIIISSRQYLLLQYLTSCIIIIFFPIVRHEIKPISEKIILCGMIVLSFFLYRPLESFAVTLTKRIGV